MADTIKLRRGTATQWSTANPVLADGEPGYDETNDQIRMGNGTSAWSALTALDASAVSGSAILSALAGSDGAGSGLDADLLDGQQGAAYAADANVVHTAGNETIAGIKTFSATPVVPDNSWTLAKLADMATARVLGRSTAGSGDIEELTIAQTKALLAIASGDVSGLGSLATLSTVDSAHITDGTVVAGDVAAGTFETTVDRTLNTQTNDYTLVLTDQFHTMVANKASGIAFTIPTNASVAFPVGTRIPQRNIGAGVLTITPTGGVTLNGVATVQQWNEVWLVKTNTDTWQMVRTGIAGGNAAPPADVQVFIASGTWTKPTPPAGAAAYTTARVMTIGGGGGGGGGRRGAAGTVRCGGGGGGGAGWSESMFPLTALGTSETVTIGTGGTSGASAAGDDADGGVGGSGGTTTIGTVLWARGGTGGSGGTATTGTGGAGANAQVVFVGLSGGSASVSGGAGSGSAATFGLGAMGGGSGGGVTTGNVANDGGQGTNRSVFGILTANTTGGVAPGGAGSTGTPEGSATSWTPGRGASGGAGHGAGVGGAGGTGPKFGGGGGGGGGSANGFASGAGGAGGSGLAVVICT